MNQAQFDAVMSGNRTIARGSGGLCLHWEGKQIAVDYMERRIATIKPDVVRLHVSPELAHKEVATEMRRVFRLLGLKPQPEISCSFQHGFKVRVNGDIIRPDETLSITIKR